MRAIGMPVTGNSTVVARQGLLGCADLLIGVLVDNHHAAQKHVLADVLQWRGRRQIPDGPDGPSANTAEETYQLG